MAMFDDRNLLKYSKMALILGSLSLGAQQFFKYDLLTMLSFGYTWLYWIIVSAVAAAGLYSIYRWRRFLN